jgi:hypothetical protein
MLKKLAYAAVTSGLFSLVSGAAMAEPDNPFPKDNSLDHAVVVGASEIKSPFPKDNSIDHGIHVSV